MTWGLPQDFLESRSCDPFGWRTPSPINDNAFSFRHSFLPSYHAMDHLPTTGYLPSHHVGTTLMRLGCATQNVSQSCRDAAISDLGRHLWGKWYAGHRSPNRSSNILSPLVKTFDREKRSTATTEGWYQQHCEAIEEGRAELRRKDGLTQDWQPEDASLGSEYHATWSRLIMDRVSELKVTGSSDSTGQLQTFQNQIHVEMKQLKVVLKFNSLVNGS